MSLFRRCTIVFFMFFANTTFANINANNGLYLGVDVAIERHDIAVTGVALSSILNEVSYGDPLARPFIGYRFSDYFAIEGGYDDLVNDNNLGDSYWGPDHYRLYSFDFAAKGIIPFHNGLSLFAKAGAAYTHQNVYNLIFADYFLGPFYSNTNVIQPLIGGGVSYNFKKNKNIAVDLSYMNLFKNSNVGNIAICGIGISYTFGAHSHR